MDEQATGTEWEAVKRIIALFYALARRAETAATRSLTVRFLILWALRRSEPYALDFVGSDEALTPFWRNSASDALRLARIFRLAARSLEKQLRMERRLVRKARAAEQAMLTPEEQTEEPDAGSSLLLPAQPQPAALPTSRRLGFRAHDSPVLSRLRVRPRPLCPSLHPARTAPALVPLAARAPGDGLHSFRRKARCFRTRRWRKKVSCPPALNRPRATTHRMSRPAALDLPQAACCCAVL